ncbi:MAG: hypothetical protein AAFP90_20455, partial [Planctomycetota bacterium]
MQQQNMLNVQHHTQPTHILHDAAIMLSEGDGCDVAVTAHPWWLKTWFDAFHAGSTGTDACVVSVRDESDQLLAVLPLIRTCTTTGSILHWMGGGIACSDGITPYVRDSLNPQIRSSVMAAAARYLISMRRDSELRWDSLEMDGIIEGDLGMRQWIDSLRHEGCGVHSWSRMHVWRRQIVGDWEIGLASCSKTTRRGYRKSLQTLAGDEFVLHVVTDHDSEQSWSTAMATLIDLHQSRWNAEDQPGSFADPAMQRLMDGLWTGLRDFRTLIHVAATSDASSSPKTSGGERSKRRRSRQKRKLETNLQNQHDAAIQHQCTGTPNGDLQHGMRLVILRHTDKPIAAELQLIGTSPSGKCLSSYSSG